jgi:hypothetical protein
MEQGNACEIGNWNIVNVGWNGVYWIEVALPDARR